MFWVYLILSALISRADYDQGVTAQNAQLPRLTEAKGLSTKAEEGQMTNLLDVLTIYRSVISLNPADANLHTCCDSATATPHLDLMLIFTRHVHAWAKYASASLYQMVADSTVQPCLPEAKPSGAVAVVRSDGGGSGPPPPPDPPPMSPLPKKPREQVSVVPYTPPPSPPGDQALCGGAGDGSPPPSDLPPLPPPHPPFPKGQPPPTSLAPFTHPSPADETCPAPAISKRIIRQGGRKSRRRKNRKRKKKRKFRRRRRGKEKEERKEDKEDEEEEGEDEMIDSLPKKKKTEEQRITESMSEVRREEWNIFEQFLKNKRKEDQSQPSNTFPKEKTKKEEKITKKSEDNNQPSETFPKEDDKLWKNREDKNQHGEGLPIQKTKKEEIITSDSSPQDRKQEEKHQRSRSLSKEMEKEQTHELGQSLWKHKKEEEDEEKGAEGDIRAWRTEITAMGSMLTEPEDMDGSSSSSTMLWTSSPVVWLVTGTALGVGLATVWVVLQRRHRGHGVRFQDSGDVVRDVRQAIASFFQDREAAALNLNNRQDSPDDGSVLCNENLQNRNESLTRRLKRLRRRYRRLKRRRRLRGRKRHQYDSSPPTSSQTVTEGSSNMTSLEVLDSPNTSTTPALDANRPVTTSAVERSCQTEKVKRAIKHERMKRKLRRERKWRGGSRDKAEWPPPLHVDSESGRVRFSSSDGQSSYTTSDSVLGEFDHARVDNVQPDRLNWEDSDEYSEAHSVSRMMPASQSHSTCSSLREEFTGPWVSTSLSFVVYDLDVIDDIPNEVLEVLSCDQKPCEIHPHDRYHYVGSKIIVQRLPLPSGVSEQDPCTSYLPHLHFSATDTITTTCPPPVDPGSQVTAPHNKDAAQRKTKEEKVFVSIACNTETVSVGNFSMQTMTEATMSIAVNTLQLHTSDSSSQTFGEDSVSIGVNTRHIELVECSQQTTHLDLVSKAVNTTVLKGVDRSVQVSNIEDLVSTAVNTECVNKLDQAIQVCDRANLSETAMNTEPLNYADFFPRRHLVSSASNTEPANVEDFTTQASLDPIMEISEHRDVSTQTAVERDDFLQPQTFPLTMRTHRFCAPAAKAASASFRGSGIQTAVAYVKETYEECLKNPSGETYYPKYSPSPKSLLQSSLPFKTREGSDLGSNQRFMTSPPSKNRKRKESPQNPEGTPSLSPRIPESLHSVSDSVAFAVNTIKGVYDHCMKSASPKQLESPTDGSGYSNSSKQSNAGVPKSKISVASKLDAKARKQASKPAEKMGDQSAVSHNVDPWTKHLQDTGQASGKSAKATSNIRIICKPKQGATPTGTMADKAQVAAQKSGQPAACKLEAAGKAAISKNHSTQRQKETPYTPSHIPVSSNKTDVSKKSNEASSSKVTRKYQDTLGESKKTEKSAYKPGQAEITSQKYDLFRELREKVAKRQLSQEEIAKEPSKSLSHSQSRSMAANVTASETTEQLASTSSQGQAGTEHQGQCMAQAINKSHVTVPSQEAGYVSTQKICNRPQSKKGIRSSETVPEVSDKEKETGTPGRENMADSFTALFGRMFSAPQQEKEEDSIPITDTIPNPPTSTQQGHDQPERNNTETTENIHTAPGGTTDSALSDQGIETGDSLQPRPQQRDNSGSPSTLCIISLGEAGSEAHQQPEAPAQPQIQVSSHGKKETQTAPTVCITVQDKENTPLHKVCIVSQPDTEGQSSPKASSPQKVPKLSSPKIYIMTQQSSDSPSPPKVRIISHQKEDEQTAQKVCIIPRHIPGAQSPPKVCIISKQKKAIQPPAAGYISNTENCELSSSQKMISSATKECSLGSGFQPRLQQTICKRTLTPDGLFHARGNQDPGDETGIPRPFEFLQQECPPCFTQVYTDNLASAKESCVKANKHFNSIFATPQEMSKNRPWGSIEQIYERRQKRNAVPDTNQRVSVTSVANEIKQIYERCMTGKFKPKKIHQTKSKNTMSQTNRPGYEQFDELASTTGVKEEASYSDSKQRDSMKGQHDKKQEARYSNHESDTLKQAGDSGPFTVLPLAITTISKSPGSGPPSSPSEQDSSNSAERVSSETLYKEQTRSSSPHVEKKEPYESLSRVSIKDASPPWEVSDRAKNNVFSPVGWTSPRSGITSLFRAQSSQKGDQVDPDADKPSNLQTYTAKEESYGKQGDTPLTEERAAKSSTVHSAISVTQQKASQHNAHTLNSKNTSSARLRSSVRHNVHAHGPSETHKDKHYCTLHPDMAELARLRQQASRPKLTSTRHCGSASSDHRPRIVSKYRMQKQKSTVPKHLEVSVEKLPSKPSTAELMANQLSKNHSPEKMKKTSEKSADTEDTVEENEQRMNSEAGPSSEANKMVSINDRSQFLHNKGSTKFFQVNGEDNEAQFCGKNIVMQSGPIDTTLSRNICSKYRLCQYTNDLNAELKDKLNASLRPSEIKRGKRKSECHTAIECENVRTTISTRCNNEPKTFLPSKSKRKLPISSHNQPLQKDETNWHAANVHKTMQDCKRFHDCSGDIAGSHRHSACAQVTEEQKMYEPSIENANVEVKNTNPLCDDNFKIKRRAVKRTAANASEQTSTNGYESYTNQTSRNMSKIPILKALRSKNPVEKSADAGTVPDIEHLGFSYNDLTTAPKDDQLLTNSHQSREDQVAAQAIDQTQYNQGIKHEDTANSDPAEDKGNCSRLPVPSVSSSRKCFLSEVQDKSRTTPVSCSIAERIQLLHTSVLNGQTTKPRDTKRIRKLTSYLESDEKCNDKNKTDVAKDDEDRTAHNVELLDTSTADEQNTMATFNSSTPAAPDNHLENTRDPIQLPKRQSHPYISTEENISQNHNWIDLSFESLFSSQNIDEDMSLSLCSVSSSTTDLASIEITNSTEEKQTPTSRNTWVDQPMLVHKVTKELKKIAKAYEGKLYPSQIKQYLVASEKCSKCPDSLGGGPSAFVETSEKNIAQKLKRESKSHSNITTKKDNHASSSERDPGKSWSTGSCDTENHSGSQKVSSSLSNHDQSTHSECSRNRENQTLHTKQKKSVPTLPCRRAKKSMARTGRLDKATPNSLLHADTANEETVIGPPQANSSFMEDSDLCFTSDNILNYHEFGAEFSNENHQVISMGKSKLHSIDRMGDPKKHHQATMRSFMMRAKACDKTDSDFVNEIPVAGSIDIMRKFWRKALKKHNGTVDNLVWGPDCPRRQAEMLHFTDVGREQQNFHRCLKGGRAWILKNRVNRITAKGDNLSVLNSDVSPRL